VADLREFCLLVLPPSTDPAMPASSSTFKAAEDDKVMPIDAEDPTKTIQIEADLNPRLEGGLVDFLRCNKDIFVWSSEEMLSIARKVTEHTLNIKPVSKPVKQGGRCYNQKKQ
jgi:hypothetical protein